MESRHFDGALQAGARNVRNLVWRWVIRGFYRGTYRGYIGAYYIGVYRAYRIYGGHFM